MSDKCVEYLDLKRDGDGLGAAVAIKLEHRLGHCVQLDHAGMVANATADPNGCCKRLHSAELLLRQVKLKIEVLNQPFGIKNRL